MSVNVTATLRKAVRELEAEKVRLDHQLAAIRGLLGGGLDRAKRRRVRPVRRTRISRRPRVSTAARRAISQRMKAYWAKRKAAAAKGKATPRKK